MSIKAKKRAAAPTPYSKSTSLKIISRVIIILLSLTVVYPLIFIVLVSFKNNQEFYSNIFGLPQVWRFENYAAAWVEGKIGLYAFNSIVVTVAAVIGSVLFTALGGYALSKMHIPGAKAIITALMTLNFVPGVAVYIPLYMQMIDMKLSGSLWMLILPYLTWHIPFSIYIFKNFFDSILGADGGGPGGWQRRGAAVLQSDSALGAARRRYGDGVQFHRHLGRIHVGQHRLLVLHQDSDDPGGTIVFPGRVRH